jgi:hypothetical protein
VIDALNVGTQLVKHYITLILQQLQASRYGQDHKLKELVNTFFVTKKVRNIVVKNE